MKTKPEVITWLEAQEHYNRLCVYNKSKLAAEKSELCLSRIYFCSFAPYNPDLNL